MVAEAPQRAGNAILLVHLVLALALTAQGIQAVALHERNKGNEYDTAIDIHVITAVV